MFCSLGSENDDDTHLWQTSSCVCCWSPVWRAECRWQVVPALWWLSSRASGSETQNRSFEPLSLKRPHLETGPCRPALLATQIKVITMNGWWMTSRWCWCATSPLTPSSTHPHSSPRSWRCDRARAGGKTRECASPLLSRTPAGCRHRNRSPDPPGGWREWSPVSGDTHRFRDYNWEYI